MYKYIIVNFDNLKLNTAVYHHMARSQHHLHIHTTHICFYCVVHCFHMTIKQLVQFLFPPNHHHHHHPPSRTVITIVTLVTYTGSAPLEVYWLYNGEIITEADTLTYEMCSPDDNTRQLIINEVCT